MIAILLSLHILGCLQKTGDTLSNPTFLGSIRADDLWVRLATTESDHHQSELKLLFERTNGEKVLFSTTFDCGPSFGLPRTLSIMPMLGDGRSQVFISARRMAVSSFLLDFDGHKVKTIYSRTEGRVDAMPILKPNGKVMILEIWSPRAYKGVFHADGKIVRSGPFRGMVLRYVSIPKH